MSDTPIRNVSDTAVMVAMFRAQESASPSPLFRDPLAARLGGEAGRLMIARLPKRAFLGGWSVVIRTWIIDRMIGDAIAGVGGAPAIDTVINLGAGLDTRPYRLDLPPHIRWIEADFESMISFKNEQLTGQVPRCRLERHSVDLGNHDARRRFLDSAVADARYALVLTEGVLPYLKPDEVAALATDLHRLPKIHRWITDYFSPASFRFRRRSGMRRALRHAPFRFEPEDFFGFFRERGWQKRDIQYLTEVGQRLGRPLPLPPLMKVWVSVVSKLMSAEKRQAMQRFSGYVVLERA